MEAQQANKDLFGSIQTENLLSLLEINTSLKIGGKDSEFTCTHVVNNVFRIEFLDELLNNDIVLRIRDKIYDYSGNTL